MSSPGDNKVFKEVDVFAEPSETEEVTEKIAQQYGESTVLLREDSDIYLTEDASGALDVARNPE